MMEVYHTSDVVVEHPDTKHSRMALDFGPGFYFTSMRHQQNCMPAASSDTTGLHGSMCMAFPMIGTDGK